MNQEPEPQPTPGEAWSEVKNEFEKLFLPLVEWVQKSMPQNATDTNPIEKSKHEYLNRKNVTLEHKFQYILTSAISDALPHDQVAELKPVREWTDEIMIAISSGEDNK